MKMSWTKQQKDFGILKIDKQTVKIYSTQSSYSTINVGQEIRDVRWNGDVLLVSLTNGKVRRYKTQSSYDTI
jgi:hypothetical protein